MEAVKMKTLQQKQTLRMDSQQPQMERIRVNEYIVTLHRECYRQISPNPLTMQVMLTYQRIQIPVQ